MEFPDWVQVQVKTLYLEKYLFLEQTYLTSPSLANPIVLMPKVSKELSLIPSVH